jgi:GNAT superfamily N-acetyltransferase
MPLPEGIKIRVGRRGDRDSIYRLLAEVQVDVAPAEQSNTLSWIVSHPEIEVLLAVDPLDRGVGLLALSHRPQLRLGGRIATVDELVVTAPLRRRGIGTELLDRAVARARMLGCKAVEIGARDGAGRAYLERRGFSGQGTQVMTWQNPGGK